MKEKPYIELKLTVEQCGYFRALLNERRKKILEELFLIASILEKLNAAETKKTIPDNYVEYKKGNWARPNAKLTELQVAEIKYRVPREPGYKIAKTYGVSQSTIHLIKHGMIWREVKPTKTESEQKPNQ